MAKKWGLGKGLSALLPVKGEEGGLQEEAEPLKEAQPALPGEHNSKTDKSPPAGESPGSGAPEDRIRQIPLEKLRPNPEQARKSFDDGDLAELADSIRENGIINPLIAEEAADGSFVIVAGERRYRAAKLAGLTEAPVLVRSFSGEKRMIVSLIENIQRADLKPIEEAAAYRSLMELAGLSQEEAAAKVGKNRATVANALRLLKLPLEMQESLQMGDITPGHGRAILSVEDLRGQDLLFREILKKGLSVREAEKRAAELSGGHRRPKPAAAAPASRPPELAAMEEKFIGRLGTKAVIQGDLNRGVIIIDYYSMEDLDRLYGILGG